MVTRDEARSAQKGASPAKCGTSFTVLKPAEGMPVQDEQNNGKVTAMGLWRRERMKKSVRK
jgi:hypothetical protein